MNSLMKKRILTSNCFLRKIKLNRSLNRRKWRKRLRLSKDNELIVRGEESKRESCWNNGKLGNRY